MAQGQPKLPIPDQGIMLGALAALLLLVVLWLPLRGLLRRKGGWRRTWRWAKWQVRLTARAFGDPVRAHRRHRRAVRLLAERIADPATAGLAARALDAVDAALAGAPGAYGYAVVITPASASVTVRVAGRRLPPPPAPWRTVGPTSWQAPAEDLGAPDGGRPRVPLVLGSRADGVVVVDLLRGPGVLTVEGDSGPARTLVQALAAQLEPSAGPAGLVVARGVHPRYEGPELEVVLDALERPVGEDGAAPVTVACADPDEEQARRVQALAATGRAAFLVRGRTRGHRTGLRVDAAGRVTADGLGLTAEGGPLARAVARAVRRTTSPAPRRTSPAAPRPAAQLPPPEATREPTPATAAPEPTSTTLHEPERSAASPAGVSATSPGPRTGRP
ncbi:hypothetical protein [Kitasatospora sp. NPDC089509]|uniref:hypothetical protein n=1 Tax=Kitasatospora sp. NPDC089509 TaxID=3364079 RepID=UPI003809EBE8